MVLSFIVGKPNFKDQFKKTIKCYREELGPEWM